MRTFVNCLLDPFTPVFLFYTETFPWSILRLRFLPYISKFFNFSQIRSIDAVSTVPNVSILRLLPLPTFLHVDELYSIS